MWRLVVETAWIVLDIIKRTFTSTRAVTYKYFDSGKLFTVLTYALR